MEGSLLLRLLTEHVYLILFVSLILEFVALPIPGETMMVLAGVMGYHGHANYWLMIIAGSLGTIIGMQVSYEVGRRLGVKAIDKYGSYIGLTKPRMAQANKFFNKYGNIIIFIAYYLPGVRHILGYFSGISKIDSKKFHIYSTIGGIVWVVTFITMGYIVGPAWKHVFFLMHQYGIILLLLALSGLLIFLVFKKLGKKEFLYELKTSLKFYPMLVIVLTIISVCVFIFTRSLKSFDTSLKVSTAIILLVSIIVFLKYNHKNKTSKKALVVVDYQKDFVYGALGFSGAENIYEVIESKIKERIAKNEDVIFTFDTHTEDYLDTREGKQIPVLHCIKETEGHQLYGNLSSYLETAKRTYEKDVFGSIELAKYIAKSDYEEIEFCGLISNVCVLSNIILVQTLNKEVNIVVDLSATLSNDKTVNQTLKVYLEALGVTVKD